MTKLKNCRRHGLAERASFSVGQCECGALHLTIGYVTMRLEAYGHREMAAAAIEASRSSAGAQQADPPLTNISTKDSSTQDATQLHAPVLVLAVIAAITSG